MTILSLIFSIFAKAELVWVVEETGLSQVANAGYVSFLVARLKCARFAQYFRYRVKLRLLAKQPKASVYHDTRVSIFCKQFETISGPTKRRA